ncbi:MAG: HAD family hydrolase [Myxococcota bacterium]
MNPRAGHRRIRAIVSDLDGTLWSGRAEVHPATRAALDTLEAREVPVAFATGRRLVSAREGLDPLGWEGPLITMNGAVGTDLRTGEEWHRCAFTAAQAATLWEQLTAAALRPVVYVCDRTTDVILPEGCSTSAAHYRHFPVGAPVDPRPWMDSGRIIGFALCGVRGDVARRAEGVARQLMASAEVHVGPDATYGGLWLAIGPRAATKETAVAAWCTARGLSSGGVLAVGDGGNDLGLLAWAGLSVAVRGSACAAVGADALIDPPSTGGWAQLLELL